MSKYFEDSKKIVLKQYYDICDKSERDIVLKILICLGDVEISEALLKAYIVSSHTFGGRYDVRTDPKTIKGLYKIYTKFPRLSAEAFEEICDIYIDDLFIEYDLIFMFDKIIKVFGETDQAVIFFFYYVDEKADELSKMYDQKAHALYRLSPLYDVEYKEDYNQYIAFLYRIIMREHIPVDAVIDSIPSPEIVKKDIHQLDQLAKEYGTFMYLVEPLSFEITKSLAKGEDISKYKDQPSYYLYRDGQYEDATFTMKEFLDSIDSKKTKELMKEPESFQQRMIKKFGKK